MPKPEDGWLERWGCLIVPLTGFFLVALVGALLGYGGGGTLQAACRGAGEALVVALALLFLALVLP